jgi:hypothetical protein
VDRRKLNLKDREHRIREALEQGKAREPRGVKPADAVVPTLTAEGACRCPQCGGTCNTPVAWNPWNGLDEKMVLVHGKVNNCPHCRCRHFVTRELARAHNHYWFPEDRQFMPTS